MTWAAGDGVCRTFVKRLNVDSAASAAVDGQALYSRFWPHCGHRVVARAAAGMAAIGSAADIGLVVDPQTWFWSNHVDYSFYSEPACSPLRHSDGVAPAWVLKTRTKKLTFS